ncbi:MAG: FAD-containing oxidoreductase, partial [Persicimonas sp.]
MSTTADSVERPWWTSKYARLAAVVLFLAVIVALFALFPVVDYIDDFIHWVHGFDEWAGVVFGSAYVVATVALVPGTPLTVVAGFAFGLFWGAIIAHAGSTLSAAISFIIGRFVARDWVAERIEEYPRFDATFRAIDKDAFKVVALARMVPVFPFSVLNYGFAVTGVSFWRYITASFIGMIPATLVYVYMGTIAGNLARVAAGDAELTPLQDALFVVGGIAAVAITVLLTRRAREELDKIAAEAQQEAVEHDEIHVEPIEVPEVLPDDAYNRRLLDNVHPRDWTNPLPTGGYNLVVIGAGTGGLVSAAGAAGLGAKVALIERHLMGGDCLNHGCVPSKALLRAARAVADVRRAGEFGVRVEGEPIVDFAAIMERMRRLRADISEADSAERFDNLGVDVYLGQARFVAPDAVEVGGQTLAFNKAIIATGARPKVPPINGLEEAGFLTNESIFTLTELPERLAVLGGGPIGAELAQAFSCFGSQVVLLEMQQQILPREAPKAAAIVERALRDDGVDMRLGAEVSAVHRMGEKESTKVVEFRQDGQTDQIEVDEILVSFGRRPNVAGLGLHAAEVDHDPNTGVHVDDRLQTSNKKIYAVGDVASRYNFTHLADAMARMALKNALFFGRDKMSSLFIPWVTYTDPEIAHVGLYEHEAAEQGYEVDTFVERFDDLDRAVVSGQTSGLLEVHVDHKTGELLGATMVARHAGEMISELTLAMQADLDLSDIADTIHPYPTESEAIKHLADDYNRTRLKGWMR